MKGKKRQNGPDDASDIGVVRVYSNPGPDAEDRLRRLITLMVRYATNQGDASTFSEIALDQGMEETDAPEKASPSLGVPETDG